MRGVIPSPTITGRRWTTYRSTDKLVAGRLSLNLESRSSKEAKGIECGKSGCEGETSNLTIGSDGVCRSLFPVAEFGIIRINR